MITKTSVTSRYSLIRLMDCSSVMFAGSISNCSSCSRTKVKFLSTEIPTSPTTHNGRTIEFVINTSHPINFPPTSKLNTIKKLSITNIFLIVCAFCWLTRQISFTRKQIHWKIMSKHAQSIKEERRVGEKRKLLIHLLRFSWRCRSHFIYGTLRLDFPLISFKSLKLYMLQQWLWVTDLFSSW